MCIDHTILPSSLVFLRYIFPDIATINRLAPRFLQRMFHHVGFSCTLSDGWWSSAVWARGRTFSVGIFLGLYVEALQIHIFSVQIRVYLGGETSNIFYVHPENWGRWSHFDEYFANGLVQPPTSHGWFMWVYVSLHPSIWVLLTIGVLKDGTSVGHVEAFLPQKLW